MEKVWVIDDPDKLLRELDSKRTRKNARAPARAEKDPARAYTLSLLFWGGGQLYNDQLVKGTLFLCAMLLCCAGAVLAVVYRSELVQLLQSSHVSIAFVFLLAEALFFCMLIFWTYNAGDAYHTAAKGRKTPFPGVSSRFKPLLCSLLVPGWGQFLNGQPVKGSIFTGLSVLGFFTVVSVPACLRAWPLLEISTDRFIIEAIFAVVVLYAPLVPFIWIFGGFDAWKVSYEELKKERLLDRIKAANNRRRTQGWVRGVFPRIKSALALALVLIFLLLVIHNSFPKNFYREQMANAQARLQDRGMVIVPDLIGRVLSIMALSGK